MPVYARRLPVLQDRHQRNPADEVHRDDHVVTFRDIHPQARVRCLLVPTITTTPLVAADDRHALAALVRPREGGRPGGGRRKSGYRLLSNTGAGAGQTVFHAHLHLLGTSVRPAGRSGRNELSLAAPFEQHTMGTRPSQAIGGRQPAKVGSATVPDSPSAAARSVPSGSHPTVNNLTPVTLPIRRGWANSQVGAANAGPSAADCRPPPRTNRRRIDPRRTDERQMIGLLGGGTRCSSVEDGLLAADPCSEMTSRLRGSAEGPWFRAHPP